MNEALEKFSQDLIKLLNKHDKLHVDKQIQALLSIAISIAYQFVDKGKEKDYIIKTVASKLKFFEKNYNKLRDENFMNAEDESTVAFKVKLK